MTEGEYDDDNDDNDDDDASINSIDESQPLLTHKRRPGQGVAATQGSYMRRLLRAGASPLLNQAAKALMVYFVNVREKNLLLIFLIHFNTKLICFLIFNL